MEINITPDDVNTFVKDAILKAGIGQAITKAINDALLPGNYNNPVNKEIQNFIGQIASEMIRERFAGKVREAVQGEIEKRVTDELISTTVEKTVGKMIEAANRGY